MKLDLPAPVLRIVMLYVASRKTLWMWYSDTVAGRHGSIRRPSNCGFTPRRYSETAFQFQAAVPVSQLFLPSPGRAASFPATIWQ